MQRHDVLVSFKIEKNVIPKCRYISICVILLTRVYDILRWVYWWWSTRVVTQAEIKFLGSYHDLSVCHLIGWRLRHQQIKITRPKPNSFQIIKTNNKVPIHMSIILPPVVDGVPTEEICSCCIHQLQLASADLHQTLSKYMYFQNLTVYNDFK